MNAGVTKAQVTPRSTVAASSAPSGRGKLLPRTGVLAAESAGPAPGDAAVEVIRGRAGGEGGGEGIRGGGEGKGRDTKFGDSRHGRPACAMTERRVRAARRRRKRNRVS